MTQVSKARFPDEAVIREYLEAIRWPKGPVCPHCGTVDHAYRIANKPGLYRCGHAGCRKNFNVKSRTLFEWSHIPLNKWLLATHLILSSEESVSARQLGRILGIRNYRPVWLMARRIRQALLPMPKRRRFLDRDAIRRLFDTPAKHTTRRPPSAKKEAQRKRRRPRRSVRLRAVALTLLATALSAGCSCAPFQSVPGDVCNGPTQNYPRTLPTNAITNDLKELFTSSDEVVTFRTLKVVPT